jgi:hypothetical protein
VTAAVLTPFVRDAARGGNKTWRKRLLPVGEIKYKDRIIKFSKEYLGNLAEAFRSKAYDQVPFQLAGDENKHTNDVERFAGDIADMEVDMAGPDGPGLYVTLAATDRGNKVLAENPRCGVSARIVESYDRSDGKFFPAAIQHVLATLDPRIPGLGGWQAVEASNMPEIVIDLSACEFAGQEGTPMPDLTEEQKQQRMAALLEIPPEQIQALLAGMQQQAPASVPAPAAAGDGSAQDDEEDLAAWVDGLTDEQLAQLEAEFEAETAATAGATGLTNEAVMAIEMANVRADETERQLGIVMGEFDSQRFETEKRAFTRAGVPPYITDLARPLLHGSGHVVDLAGGQSVDAGQIMRRVLTEFAKAGRMLEVDVELGSPMDEPDSAARDQVVEQRTAIVQGFIAQTGLRK